ncbi:NAD(P)-binding protein [Dendrothele bispora CBS 962.96]|uniref:NAD(P)-binding protein n=1 Tax=Dendrothele bispora (strain CBS 962.96) TaxID=1314807 RepID=A0A4S8MP39_DENBC|nr:NAD(P)-binding protein [Dendrothele bispora CBS 962.96]
MSKPIVLITGGTGLTGSHIISQLLEQGQYTVRGVARSASKLKSIFPDARPDQLEIVEIPNLTSDFTEALKGVYAVIHVASATYANGATGPEIFEVAYEGTLNLIQQAIKQGIKKIVYTGAYGSLLDTKISNGFSTVPITEKDFGPITLEELDRTDTNLTTIYQASKTIAEKKAWELAHENPDVDLTVLLPPGIFGPLVPNFVLKSRESLSSNDYVYQIILNGPDAYPFFPVSDMVDVRDIARAHLAALALPPLPVDEETGSRRDKRFIVSGCKYWWKEVADLIRRERPHLAHRLPKEDVPAPVQITTPLDLSFTEKFLPGFEGVQSYYPWEDSILGALDSALALEQDGKKN